MNEAGVGSHPRNLLRLRFQNLIWKENPNTDSPVRCSMVHFDKNITSVLGRVQRLSQSSVQRQDDTGHINISTIFLYPFILILHHSYTFILFVCLCSPAESRTSLSIRSDKRHRSPSLPATPASNSDCGIGSSESHCWTLLCQRREKTLNHTQLRITINQKTFDWIDFKTSDESTTGNHQLFSQFF